MKINTSKEEEKKKKKKEKENYTEIIYTCLDGMQLSENSDFVRWYFMYLS